MSVMTKYVHACRPSIYLANGLKIDRNDMPSDAAVRYFINNILSSILIETNPPRKHKCTNLCGQSARVLLGFPNNENLKSACPGPIADMVQDFEDLLTNFYTEEGDEQVEIQSLTIRFLPCSFVTEILEIAIYM